MSNANTALKKTARRKATPDSTRPDGAAQDDGARLIADEKGNILFCNADFMTLCALPRSLEGQNINDLLEFDDPSEVFGTIGIFSMQENAFHALRDGQYGVTIKQSNKMLSLQFDWIDSPSGQRYLIAAAEEITAREKLQQYVAEKIKEKNERQLSSDHFQDMAFDAQVVCHIDGSFLSINSAFTDIFGYNEDTLQLKNISDFVPAENLNATPQDIESISNNAAGQTLWMHWKVKRVDNKIFAVGRDISATKRQQDALQRQKNRLIEAEAIGHMGQWRWEIGTDNIDFSAQLYQIFGLKPEGFKPTLDNVNAMIHRQDAGRMMQVFQRAIIEQNDYDMDFRITRPDGSVRYIRCEGRCETEPNSDDDVIALYGIMQDITDIMQREIDLRAAKESVERAYAAKTQFLANMSHELRTPLNAIIGFSEMMHRQLLGPIGTEKYLEYIGGILQSGEHLLDLISDILDMSRIEAGKYELSLEKFNIAKVIRMAVHMMEGRAVDSEIKIAAEIGNDGLNIVADRRAIMQMILNLLSNAVKFSHKGGHVTIAMIEREEYLSIKVIDNGIGIPANKLVNITQPFEQAESHYTRGHEGSGLGLAITKELAEIHGGSLHIESTLGEGTTVTIRLPYQTRK